MPIESNVLVDGYRSIIALSNIPLVRLYEKEVTPPGLSAGGPIDTTTMRNLGWRTMKGRSLKSLTNITVTVAYAVEAIEDIQAEIGNDQFVMVFFPDNSVMQFYAIVEEFTPNALTEGEQPTAVLTLVPSMSALVNPPISFPQYVDPSADRWVGAEDDDINGNFDIDTGTGRILKTAHGLEDGDTIEFIAFEAPSGADIVTPYYVSIVSANEFTLYDGPVGETGTSPVFLASKGQNVWYRRIIVTS